MSKFSPKNKSFWLAQLFESNYIKLRELVPRLEDLSENAAAVTHGKPALYLTLLERSRYTLTLELSHCFTQNMAHFLEPRIRIRVYLDGKCAEALSHCERHTIDPALQPRSLTDVIDHKWSLNYFLGRWLEHCLRRQYRFKQDSLKEPIAVA